MRNSFVATFSLLALASCTSTRESVAAALMLFTMAPVESIRVPSQSKTISSKRLAHVASRVCSWLWLRAAQRYLQHRPVFWSF